VLFGLTVKHKTTAIILSYLALGLSMPSCVTSSAGGGGSASTGTGGGTSTGTGTGTGLCTPTSCGPGELCASVSTGEPEGECRTLQCVPCDPDSGPVCDAEGHHYDSQCAAVDAGQGSFFTCVPPGPPPCYVDSAGTPQYCNPTTEVCMPGFMSDCGGFGPASCVPVAVDAGAPDGGGGSPDGGGGGLDGGDGG
jgi:hypothetical protein